MKTIIITMIISMITSLLEAIPTTTCPNEPVVSKSVREIIRTKLQNRFHPTELYVENDSYEHDVSKNSETFLKVIIVSDQFEGIPFHKRNNMINELLDDELKTTVNGLFIDAKTQAEWKANRSYSNPFYHTS